MNNQQERFDTKTFNDWNKWFDYIVKLPGDWLYRGQYLSDDLETSLERDCKRFNFRLETDAEEIENNMIRQFKRVYDGDDQQEVQSDTLYCLSLMRHYGAPTRLLDFTYSKYAAMYFGLEYAYKNVPERNGKPDYNARRSCTVWCIEQKELIDRIKRIDKVKALLKLRRDDEKRNDVTFLDLYMKNRYTFVSWENPLRLHRRLHLQQGALLCPGNIKVTFMENLLTPYGTQKTNDIKRMVCHIEPLDLHKAFHEFMRMGITRESLFPGLDGFAQSMVYQLWFYKKLAEWRRSEAEK